MIYIKSYRGDRFIGYGFINKNKINNDITINYNPIIITHPSNQYRSKIIEIEVYL